MRERIRGSEDSRDQVIVNLCLSFLLVGYKAWKYDINMRVFSDLAFFDLFENIFLKTSDTKSQSIIFIYLFLKLFTLTIEPLTTDQPFGDDTYSCKIIESSN
jgi:hypothetical protein